jgi:hypothetical protein
MSARRPALLAVAAAVAVWSAWIVWQGDADDDGIAQAADRTAAPAPLRPAPPARPRPTVPADAATATTAPPPPALGGTRVAENAAGNAFAPRSFAAAPAPAPRAAVTAAPQVEAAASLPPPPPAAPVVPPLPYRFVGLLDEAQPGGARVFLAVGDKLLVAGPGDVLDGGFRLDEIRATELVFTHVQLGRTVRLPLAGVPS